MFIQQCEVFINLQYVHQVSEIKGEGELCTDIPQTKSSTHG